MSTSVWVLLKEKCRYDSEATTTTVMGVYADRSLLDARVERMRKANSQYPVCNLGENSWRFGPEDDEGFFGHQPIYVHAVQSTLHGSIEQAVTV